MAIKPEIKARLIGLQSSLEDPYPVQVRGESNYKANFEKICWTADEEEGYKDDGLQAILYFEDDNKYDPENAIRIEIEDLTVGYLSKSDAKAYRKRLKELGTPENPIAICVASIRGGFLKKDGEKADYGVRLDFDLEGFTLTSLKFTEDEPKAAQPVLNPEAAFNGLTVSKAPAKKTPRFIQIFSVLGAILVSFGFVALLLVSALGTGDNGLWVVKFVVIPIILGFAFLFPLIRFWNINRKRPA